MKIDKIAIYHVRVPLKKTFRIADVPIEHIEPVYVRLESGGVSGWGEVFPGNSPILTAAWSSAVYHCLRDCILPLLEPGVAIASGTQLAELLAPIKGNRHAKAALDMAWWDLQAKLDGKPLYRSIGGIDKQIELGVSFDRYDSPSQFLDDIKQAVSDGFRRITMKIRPGWDLHALGAVRNLCPTDMIQCDLEGALSMERHHDMLHRFDDFMPSLLEQPLSASEYVGHAMLQDSLRANIALDESITTLHQAQIALDLRSGTTFCLKPGRVGGLTEAKAIHDAAASCEVNCYAGCDILTSIGYRAVISLASLSNCSLPADYVPLEDYLCTDPGVHLKPVRKSKEIAEAPDAIKEEKREFRLDEHGRMKEDKPAFPADENYFDKESRMVIEPWNEPGIGFDPDIEWFEKNAISRFSR